MLVETEVIVGWEWQPTQSRGPDREACNIAAVFIFPVAKAKTTLSSIDRLTGGSRPDAFEAVAMAPRTSGQMFIAFLAAFPTWDKWRISTLQGKGKGIIEMEICFTSQAARSRAQSGLGERGHGP